MVANPPANAAAIKNLEQMLIEQTPTLSKTAPKQLQEMKSLLRELKSSPTGQVSPASQKTLKSLFIWQLDLKKAAYQQKIDSLEPLVKKDPKAAKAQKALKNVLAVLDEAKKATTGTGPAAAQAMRHMESASDRARSSLLELKQGEAQPPPAALTTAMRKSLTAVPAVKDAAPPPRTSLTSMPAVSAQDPDATPPPSRKAPKAAAPAPAKAAPGKTAPFSAPQWANAKADPKKNGKK